MEKEVEILYNILLPQKDFKFYSYEINRISKLTNIPVNTLIKYRYGTNTSESLFFANKKNDYVNIFIYGNNTYIGLESERLRYERDILLGINHVEKLVEKGYYK
jgi:hypothetical protein